MRYDYTVTYDDFLESMKAYRRVSTRARIGYWVYVWVIPVIGCVIGSTAAISYIRSGRLDFGGLFFLACISLGSAFGFPARYRLGIKRAFKQRDTLLNGGIMFCEFDERTIRFVVPAGTEISYAWTTFTNFFENNQVAVFFVKDAVFHTIPKRAMDEVGWQQIHSLVERHEGIKPC